MHPIEHSAFSNFAGWCLILLLYLGTGIEPKINKYLQAILVHLSSSNSFNLKSHTQL
jgi:hypothetical protein